MDIKKSIFGMLVVLLVTSCSTVSNVSEEKVIYFESNKTYRIEQSMQVSRTSRWKHWKPTKLKTDIFIEHCGTNVSTWYYRNTSLFMGVYKLTYKGTCLELRQFVIDHIIRLGYETSSNRLFTMFYAGSDGDIHGLKKTYAKQRRESDIKILKKKQEKEKRVARMRELSSLAKKAKCNNLYVGKGVYYYFNGFLGTIHLEKVLITGLSKSSGRVTMIKGGKIFEGSCYEVQYNNLVVGTDLE